ncbi:type II toxin-antitoxin system prevent-host-death family antitoxin [Rhizobium sp. 32-5/1]|uniref:type II toxin-antitoxin system Phd/YefM family antitoxin n=1 Tax=Rhizobium sp. 32-5/1 TaxID=3019602 RepID=UPI00240E8789|nr:type II toxin-antitoxin system prevent-host-death family antitoxin [Rhizobium sp. 32-5/1]WEZ82855.1 type II toxin-antitoxin system prevent-host-death family antitoxin [Rhizobium sp. 32-5/1]
MSSIGAFEAKTHFSSLLDRVANGEEITITKHGKAVARLVSAEATQTLAPVSAFRKLKELRRSNTLDGLSWKDLRDEGRK